MVSPVAHWLVEHGIGETRAILIEGEQAIAAKVFWPGELNPGTLHEAQLISKPSGTRRGVARSVNGIEVLVDKLPSDLTEGAALHVRITRAAIAERGRLKRAAGRFESPEAVEELTQRGGRINQSDGLPYPLGVTENVRQLPRGTTLDERWDEIWHAASAGSVAFVGGELLCSVTPGMSVIDIDGQGSPPALSLAAIPAIRQALQWFDLGGNIGIDFPTIEAKADRKTIDTELAESLVDWPHERTAMNGFGFVQLVARLDGPSLLHRFAASRTGMCARYALRVAERASGTGPILLLRVHPALKAKLKPEWLEELARRSGREVRLETDPALALEAPSAQVVSE